MKDEADKRWPRWIYQHGSDPDPRVTLANERTFLAWIRTSLGIAAGGIALATLDVVANTSIDRWLAAVLLLAAALLAPWAWWRWARTEAALRSRTSIPSPTGAILLMAFVCVLALIVLVTLV